MEGSQWSVECGLLVSEALGRSQERATHSDPVAAKLEVHQAAPMPHSLNFAELVLNEVEMVEIGEGIGRVARFVLERCDGT